MALVPVFRIVTKKDPATKKDTAFVRPASDVAESFAAGDAPALLFKNRTSDKVLVHLPGNVFKDSLGALIAKDFTVGLERKGALNGAIKLDEATVYVDTANANSKKGGFSYQVYCAETQSFAQGNSDPEFIIDN